MMTPKEHFEIHWPLIRTYILYGWFNKSDSRGISLWFHSILDQIALQLSQSNLTDKFVCLTLIHSEHELPLEVFPEVKGFEIISSQKDCKIYFLVSGLVNIVGWPLNEWIVWSMCMKHLLWVVVQWTRIWKYCLEIFWKNLLHSNTKLNSI